MEAEVNLMYYDSLQRKWFVISKPIWIGEIEERITGSGANAIEALGEFQKKTEELEEYWYGP